ncbi:MAG: glutamate racemase [Treponema sp.]|nr:glutamate racemase [Treponema sp.]
MIFGDMERGTVIFLDSGIGGLPYGGYFHERNRGVDILCVADRANFPYGPKKKEELVELLRGLTEQLVDRWHPAVLALACNTASVSALGELREFFPGLPIVGTVPAVKPAVLESKTRRIGVLGTERTVADPYIAALGARYGPDCSIWGEAAPDLVEFVEHRYAGAAPGERLGAVIPWVEKFRAAGADAIVLGCTHFLLLREEFAKAAAGISIHDSLEGVCRRIEELLEAAGGPAASPRKGRAELALTGGAPPEPYWGHWAEHFGLRLVP